MKKTVDDLRIEYKQLTGKEPAVRWNKKTLLKKMEDFSILQAAYETKERAAAMPKTAGEVKPDFEKLASDHEKPMSAEAGEEPAGQDRRGGFREGAGRPVGQSDERARCERLLHLEVPDLAVKKIVQGLNLALGRFTVCGFTAEQVDSLALGVTLPLYYWFPSLEGGVGNKWTVHFQSLEYIGKPIAERMQAINQLHKQQLQQQHEKEQEHVEEKEQPKEADRQPAPNGTEGKADRGRSQAGKKRAARSGPNKKQRS